MFAGLHIHLMRPHFLASRHFVLLSIAVRWRVNEDGRAGIVTRPVSRLAPSRLA
jgi:hypothetical protein